MSTRDDELDRMLQASLARPKRSPLEYISNRFGLEAAMFLGIKNVRSTRQITNDRLRAVVERQLKRMDTGWVVDYDREYLTGLPVDPQSALRLRILNLVLLNVLMELGVPHDRLTQPFDSGDLLERPLSPGIRLLDRIESTLQLEIGTRFFAGSSHQEQGGVLLDNLNDLGAKVALKLVDNGIATDEATDADVDNIVEHILTEAADKLASSDVDTKRSAFMAWLRS